MIPHDIATEQGCVHSKLIEGLQFFLKISYFFFVWISFALGAFES